MKHAQYIFLLVALLFSACDIRIKTNDDESERTALEVRRYDRLESRYLTTGDFSALQQMNIDYPMETRTLIEDVLRLGEVNDPEINSKFLKFYQDTTLQTLIADAELEFANMADINESIAKAFARLDKLVAGLPRPTVYAQIGSLDQSIVIGDNSIGISLDKYLGKDYAIYKKFYTEQQRQNMTREYIVPDCLCFYLLAHFPLQNHDTATQLEHDLHMGTVMWVVNEVMDKDLFQSKYVDAVAAHMKRNPQTDLKSLLGNPSQIKM